jgi:hypothetical protein
MFPLPLHIYFEIAAFLASLIFLNRIKASNLKWFIPYLGFIVAVELTGRYIGKELGRPNVWLYNLSIPIEYLFIAFVFYSFYKKRSSQYLGMWFLILFSIFVLLNITVIQGMNKFNTNTLVFGSFFMLVFSILYFSEMYRSEDTVEFYKDPMFWISIGVMLFNAGEFAYNLLSHYLINMELDKAARFFASINNKLILVLYSCFAISFIWGRTTETSKKV